MLLQGDRPAGAHHADKYAADNIRMNNVLPGFIDSLPEKEEFRTRIPRIAPVRNHINLTGDYSWRPEQAG